MNEKVKKLSDLKVGQSCIIESLSSVGAVRRRLIDLGFAPGASVECIGISPLGDPKAYCVRQTVIALRRGDAGEIRVMTE